MLKKKIRIGVNGFGRIGRILTRLVIEDPKIDLVVVNSRADEESHKYLLKHDSIYGEFGGELKAKILQEDHPSKVDWNKLGVDILVEATGKFNGRESEAKKVIVTAGSKEADLTMVMGVNEGKYDKNKHRIVSNASCTTNCAAVVMKVLVDNFKVEQAMMSTVHAYTADQELQDGSHRKMERGRAAAENIVVTSTGASEAVCQVIPELKGKFIGRAIRVPVSVGSLVELVVKFDKALSQDGLINQALIEASKGKMKGILRVTEENLVSSDIVGDPHSAIVQTNLTETMGDSVRLWAWYDNEWGYCSRLIDLIKLIGK